MIDEKCAREYLEQVKMIDVKINQDLERLEDMKNGALGIRAMRYDTEKVQSSPSDRLCADVVRIEELNEKINSEIDGFVDAKNKVIEQIQGLNKPVHAQVLFKVYVQFKSLKEAASEVGLSYGTTLIKHSEALREFYRKYAPLGYLS